jgi:DNA mismatch repair ATPase MutS
MPAGYCIIHDVYVDKIFSIIRANDNNYTGESIFMMLMNEVAKIY